MYVESAATGGRAVVAQRSAAHAADVLVLDSPTLLRTGPEIISLDQLIVMWLDAKRSRSGSVRTEQEYRVTLTAFRAFLQANGRDLDMPDTSALSGLIGRWASLPRTRDGDEVAGATRNRRLSILSSFYTYARKHGCQIADPVTGVHIAMPNPVDLTERSKVDAYAGAKPIPFAEVSEKLDVLDMTTLRGKRDYALLVLLLTTGRRVAELVAMRCGHIAEAANSGHAEITWPRTKGGKTCRDILDSAVYHALVDWIAAFYGAPPNKLAPETPVWVSLATNHTRGHPLTAQAVADICAKVLGNSKVHATRHTFAMAMEEAGATLTEIQQKLQHSNPATTGLYMNRLKSANNPFVTGVANLFNIHARQGASGKSDTTATPKKRARGAVRHGGASAST